MASEARENSSGLYETPMDRKYCRYIIGIMPIKDTMTRISRGIFTHKRRGTPSCCIMAGKTTRSSVKAINRSPRLNSPFVVSLLSSGVRVEIIFVSCGFVYLYGNVIGFQYLF